MEDQQLWNQLLKLKSRIDTFSGELSFCYFSEKEISLNQLPQDTHISGVILSLLPDLTLDTALPILYLQNFNRILVKEPIGLDEKTIRFLKLYLPYCLGSYQARRLERCISIAHFAQSLDGKIATEKGDSRWIGNEENLIHAHRMRALCDGIIVGSNTVRYDKPRLTVRMVEGENPRRIIIGNSKFNLDSLLSCCSDSILVVSKQSTIEHELVENLRITSENCKIESAAILKALFQKGIYSVYIEGGAQTTSNFLRDQAVDILQLHIAPLVFGSGKQGITLPGIDAVEEGQRFQHFEFYNVGNSVMFVGAL